MSKGLSFKEIGKNIVKNFDSLFIPPSEKTTFNMNSYIDLIDSGAFRNKIVYGISEKTGDYYSVNPVEQPGAAYIGGMGSGKSVAMRFSVYTHMAANSDNTMYILFDSEKSMGDYKSAIDDAEKREVGKRIQYRYSGVVAALNDVDRFIPLINMVYQEMLERKKEFTRVGAENIEVYEKILKDKTSRFYDPNFKSIARIMFCIEEFHSIGSAKNIGLMHNTDKEGSAAFQFKILMRTGRSYGINYMIATQRATSDDVPGTIKTGITTWCAFKTNNPGDAAMANLPAAADIPSGLRGRCAYEGGFMQYPYIGDLAANELLQSRVKPFVAKLLKYSINDYRDAAEKEGASAMVDISPLSIIVNNNNQFHQKDVARRILTSFGFSLESQTNTSLIADYIAKRGENSYAVVSIKKREETSGKFANNLEKSLPLIGVTKIIVLALEGGNENLRLLCDRSGGIYADFDELKRAADLVDNRDKFSDQEQFNKLYNELVLSEEYSRNPSIIKKAEGDVVVNGGSNSLVDKFAAFKKVYQ